jgi:signal transduction histidine kinase
VIGLICLAVSVLILIGVRGVATGNRTDQIVTASLEVIRLVQMERLPAVLPMDKVPAVQVYDSQGKLVSATPLMQGKPPIADFAPTMQSTRAERQICGIPELPGCAIVVGFRIYQPEGDWIVYAADSNVPWYVEPTLLGALLCASLLITAVTAAGTYHLVGKTLAPVDAIRTELAVISSTDLGRRVPVPPYHDEIRRLAITVNRTLSRIESLVEQQRRFASDASHDLRSPLTAMRTQVEAALLHPGDTNWVEMSLAQLNSLERLEALVSDLLMLAKLDAGAPSIRENLDLAGLVREELDRRPRRVTVSTDLQTGVKVTGDPLRLARLFTNLLDNAERHATENVVIAVHAENGTAVLMIEDDGAGIAPDKREEVFRRFTRLDAARSKDSGGTGLGLPIAREIAQEHGGTLVVEDSPRGARFVLRLPLSRTEEERPRHEAAR